MKKLGKKSAAAGSPKQEVVVEEKKSNGKIKDQKTNGSSSPTQEKKPEKTNGASSSSSSSQQQQQQQPEKPKSPRFLAPRENGKVTQKAVSYTDLTPDDGSKSPNIYIFGAHIDWRYPPIRQGFWGLVDKIAGPGYTTSEVVLLWFYGIAFLLMIGVHNYYHQKHWSWLKHVTSLLLSINMGFGVVVSSNPLKRWYHRNGKGITGKALGMVIFEAVFETVIANYVFMEELGNSWDFFWVIGGLSTMSFVISTCVPLYLKRSMNVGLYMFQIFLASYYLPKIAGMEWYTYVIFTKYLAHLPREEPYRPNTKDPNIIVE